MNTPHIHSTPMEAVTVRVRDKVFFDGLTVLIDRPNGSDMLFNHPAVRAAYAADAYMPYWADLWPAARMLAKAILKEPWEKYEKPPSGKLNALEVACGVGLAGIVALHRGLKVTFSDIDELAVHFAALNARLNGYHDFATAAVDLRSPPRDTKYDILLGSDLLYEPRLVEPLIEFIQAVLAPAGVCFIADPDRESAKPFRWAAESAGLRVEASFARAGEPGGERTKGTIYRITHGVSPFS